MDSQENPSRQTLPFAPERFIRPAWPYGIPTTFREHPIFRRLPGRPALPLERPLSPFTTRHFNQSGHHTPCPAAGVFHVPLGYPTRSHSWNCCFYYLVLDLRGFTDLHHRQVSSTEIDNDFSLTRHHIHPIRSENIPVRYT